MSDARNALGGEHFPKCGCFQPGKDDRADDLYGLADSMAAMLHMNARINGLCPRSAPYLLALVAHMAEARFAADMAAEETPEDAEEMVPGLFIKKLRELHPVLTERLTALMARSELISLAGPGTGSVQ